MTNALYGRVLTTALKWQRLGIEAYDLFTTVLFLDRNERVTGDDTLAVQFRELQLRARDGELTATADYDFMKLLMSIEGREAEFSGPETYHLVTTREAHDETNNLEFESHIACGTPSLTILALNSGPVAAAADEKDMGNLPNALHVCLGARMMIIRNLCTHHGRAMAPLAQCTMSSSTPTPLLRQSCSRCDEQRICRMVTKGRHSAMLASTWAQRRS